MQQRQSLPPSFFAHSIVLLDPPFSRVPRLLEVFSSFCFERGPDSFFGGREGWKERGDAEKGGWKDFWN